MDFSVSPFSYFIFVDYKFVRVRDWCWPSQPAVVSPVAHPCFLSLGQLTSDSQTAACAVLNVELAMLN